MAARMTRATLSLPAELLEQVDQAVRVGKAPSRDGFVEAALRRALAEAESTAIDAALAGMATDEEYQAEARRLAEEFAGADWEALRLAESRG